MQPLLRRCVYKPCRNENGSDSFSITPEHPKETVYEAADLEKININTASVEQLKKLDGIGAALAERIVNYREEHGDFKYEYEIMNVSGIGDAKYRAIKDYITLK